jgi:GT2 family glycosyltransferase
VSKDYKKLFTLCKSDDELILIKNRLVLEVVRGAPDELRLEFFAHMLEVVPNSHAQELAASYFTDLAGSDRRAVEIDLACRTVERRGAKYVGPAQIAPLLTLSASLDVVATPEVTIARCVSALLICKAEEEAYALATRAVRASGRDRSSLSEIFKALLPERTRWWVYAVLQNQHLGDEQVVNALITLAVAAQTERRMARILLTAALTILPDAPSACLIAGWLEVEFGDVSGAFRCFRGLSRHYAEESLVGAWPSSNGMLWPQFAFDPRGFDDLLGGRPWPRISVVVPSLDQGAFIEDTLLSIVNQNYPNLQLIVVDGGSVDGALDIIERYRDRIDVLIVEPDEGQSEALNKGFRRADGALLGWMNSDDMYAPGALHAAALAWVDSEVDIVAGVCLEHDDHRLMTINKPRSHGPLSADRFGDIFENWFEGEFYFQPETFFSREIFEKTGDLDEGLKYTMDYDLWIRMAKIGAKAEVFGWPTAFFRKHSRQKTGRFLETVCEQSAVRERHALAPRPRFERRREIDDRLRALERSAAPVIGVISKRRGKIFSKEIEAELAAYAPSGTVIVFGEDETAPGVATADLILALIHVQDEDAMVERLRAVRSDRAVVGWFWDNHHHVFENYRISKTLDVVVPGHGFCGGYLKSRESRMSDSLPLCVTQWARTEVGPWFEGHGLATRSDALYGGFVDYGFNDRRRTFVLEVQKRLPGNALRLIDELRLAEYFGRSEEDRFAEWCGYKTSLVLPLQDDLSQRFFDALLTGQVPLAPYDIRDFDQVISPELQESLPVIRFSMDDPDSAVAAHAAAVAAFDRGGVDGARARHDFARENHMFSARIGQLVERLRARGDAGRQSARPTATRSRRKLFVDPQHGLGNRLRAIASAAQIAERSDRELVVVWRPDHHCDCRFDALFDYAGAVVEDGTPETAAERGAVVYNYMEAEPGGEKDAPIVLNQDRDVYVRSAFVLNSPLSDWTGQNAFLRRLRPVEAVRDLVDSVKTPFELSVHVRMEGGRKDEHLPYESPENWTARDHELIDQWRAKSHYSRFVARIDALMAEGSLNALFLAADSPEAYAAFAERYGDRLRRLQRNRYDRSAEQLRYALADAILLGRAPRMLGSTWSSFSELATRLAPGPITLEMSGTDF